MQSMLGSYVTVRNPDAQRSPLQMVESASKGMILMYAKEAILKVLNKADVNPGAARIVFPAITRAWEHRCCAHGSSALPPCASSAGIRSGCHDSPPHLLAAEIRGQGVTVSQCLVQALRAQPLVLEAACARCPSWGP